MAIVNGYATRTQLIGEIDTSGASTFSTAQLSRMDRIIYQVSREIDARTRRHFYAATETRYYTPDQRGQLWIDDLLSITTLKTDDNDDGTYETTWTAGTDYHLQPFNAASEIPPAPYLWIDLDTLSSKYFPFVQKGVQIVGRWGHYSVLNAATSLLAAAIADTTTTTITVDSGDEFEIGHIIRIGSEDMFVNAVNTSTEVLTVTRGANGTTAATHDNDSAISVYQFPVITEACLRLAVRRWFLNTAPMGVATAGVGGFGGGTTGTRWVKEDTDVDTMLQPFIKLI